jgi:hypothetical protein
LLQQPATAMYNLSWLVGKQAIKKTLFTFLSKSCLKVVKKSIQIGQKVVEKLSKLSQLGQKVAKTLPKSCKNLSKLCQT